MDVVELIREKAFLGQEFLAWLWCMSEREGALDLEGIGTVELILGDAMVLGPVLGREGARVTVRGQEASLAEAREGLRRGKLLDSLRLGMVVGGEEFWLTLRAADLGVSGLKLPAAAPVEPERGRPDLDAAALERIALINQALDAVEGLFGLYLSERLSDENGGRAAETLRAWAQEAH